MFVALVTLAGNVLSFSYWSLSLCVTHRCISAPYIPCLSPLMKFWALYNHRWCSKQPRLCLNKGGKGHCAAPGECQPPPKKKKKKISEWPLPEPPAFNDNGNVLPDHSVSLNQGLNTIVLIS